MKNTIKVEVIINFMKKHRLSKTEFCKICNISLSTLNKIMTNDNNFKIIAIFKIARIIRIQVHQMFNLD